MADPKGSHTDSPRSGARLFRSMRLTRPGAIGARPRRLIGGPTASTESTPNAARPRDGEELARDLSARKLLASIPDADGTANTATVAPSRESGVWSQDGRLLTEAVTVSGQAVELEFRVRPDEVDLWRGNYLGACFDRVVLSAWMGDLLGGVEAEAGALVCDEVTVGVGRQGRMTLSVAEGFGRPAIERWELSPADAAALRARIRERADDEPERP